MSIQKHIAWLHSQLPGWVEERIISAEQAERLQQQYPLKQQNIGQLVFSAIGATIFGLGVILFFAYNWDQMHRFLKIAIIFSGIILSHLSAQWFASRKNTSASEGLALLGTVLFGAGIWLISQIYHIDEHYPNAFALWGLGALLMAWAMQSRLQAYAAAFLIITWGLMEQLSFGGATWSASLVVLLGLAPLALRLKAPRLLLLCSSSLFLFIALDSENLLGETFIYCVFALAVLYIGGGALLSSSRLAADHGLRYVLTLPGFFVYLCILFIITFIHDNADSAFIEMGDNALEGLFFWLSFVVSIAMPLLLLLSDRLKQLSVLQLSRVTDKYHSAVIIIAALLVFGCLSGSVIVDLVVISIVANLLFITHCILLIISGSTDRRGWEVGVGCLAFSILVFARYTDLFDSLLSRAFVFLVLGAGLFWVGNFYWRKKPQ